jgi:hypothetical protein
VTWRSFELDPIRRILGGGGLWVSECVITYDGVPTNSPSVMQVADGLVTHETQYFADPSPRLPGTPRWLRRFRCATSKPDVASESRATLTGPAFFFIPAGLSR